MVMRSCCVIHSAKYIPVDVNQCKHGSRVCKCEYKSYVTWSGSRIKRKTHFEYNLRMTQKKHTHRNIVRHKSQQFRHFTASVKVHCMLNSLWVYELFLRHTFHICLITNFAEIQANDERKKKLPNTKVRSSSSSIQCDSFYLHVFACPWGNSICKMEAFVFIPVHSWIG